MAGFFDYIPMIAIILFAVGVVGVMVYERVRNIPMIAIILFAVGVVGVMVYERVRTKNIKESPS